ncbi:MAG TPA: RsbRD N-terminal domain-containing protein, partial [Planctomycetota bacterium]|nr:RsbRD N-terminal domain-containing protein [Planctomycetota bacterium]
MTARGDTDREEIIRSLRRHRERILKAWEERVRSELAPAHDLSQVALLSTLPSIVSSLPDAVSSADVDVWVSESAALAAEYGRERARIPGYTPSLLVRELQLLRRIARQIVEREVQVPSAIRNV